MAEGAPWRLIPLAALDGATNMAVDEAILDAHLAGEAPPTLRLYRFEPAAVTIGRTQTVPPALAANARARGLDVVRRPTGGRAVLHANELTYSFVGSVRRPGVDGVQSDGFLADGVAAAYREICAGLQEALAILGVELGLGDAHKPYRQLADCFLATTGSDLHWRGLKMVGSAQLRRRHGILQHGSILLDQDQALMPALLGEVNDGQGRHANLFAAAGREISWQELCSAMQAGFERAFSRTFVEAGLTSREREQADALKAQYEIGSSSYSESVSS